MTGFCYNSKRVELYDPSQARDESGKWAGSGTVQSREKVIESASKNTTVYHGTSANVLKKIRENGLEPSRKGVYGRGVYATDNQKVALEYGCLKMPESARIGGKLLIGLIEIAEQGFEKVYQEKKKTDSFKILLSKDKVPSGSIKAMKIFDAKSVRKWIFEGGKKPNPIATKTFQEGGIFVPIIIDESDIDLEVDYTGTPKDSCPIATQDIKTNLKNRAHAVEDASYGPANPKEPNEEFWTKMAKNFNTNPKEAKTMRCGNCAAFNKTSRMLACIKKGIGEDAEEVAKAGDLGFCEFFDFKCASLRTCSAWVVGGPITDKEEKSVEFFDPSQERDESGKWTSGGGSSKQGKLIEKIKEQNPNADVASEAVKTGVNNIVKAVRGAKIVAKYGGTKTSEIVKWLRSDDGDKFLKAVGDGLRVVGGGAIGAVRGVHNARFKILAGALINPALAPYFASASATKGFFDGALKEYRGQGHGRDISNAIRSKIGVKPMQAYVQSIKLQVKEPPLEDVVAYLTDVLRVSIDEAIDGKERFEVVSFFDPSQERDESGKWTGGGGASKEPSMPVYDEDENPSMQPIGESPEEAEQSKEIKDQLDEQEMKYATEFMEVIGPPTMAKNEQQNREEYKKDVVSWSKSFKESDVDEEEAKYMAQTLHHYAGSAHQEINQYLRTMDEQEAPNLEIAGMAEGMMKAIEVAPKITQKTIWRGLRSGTEKSLKEDAIHNLAKTAKKGMIIRDSGFSSFSLRESVGKQFSNWDTGTKGVQSKILIKVKNANGKGVKMPMFASSFINEKEVLLAPDEGLKVTSVKRKKQPTSALFRNDDTHVYHTEIEAEIVK